MNCPKCHYEQSAKNLECVKCGVIFAKYTAAQKKLSRIPQKNSAAIPRKEGLPGRPVADLLFHVQPDQNLLLICARGILLIFLAIWGLKFITAPLDTNYAGGSFMHLVNLPFHEAGHIFFRLLGSFMASLGGTIGQFVMPLICIIVFLLKTRDPFAASVALWWFGQNFFDIAPYVNDARSLSLPLLGGNFGHSSPYGFHDWEYLLTETGLLQYDHLIAASCLVAGSAVFLISFVWGSILLFKQYRRSGI